MTARLLVTTLSLAASLGQVSDATERSPVHIVVTQLDGAAAKRYEPLAAREASLGGALVPKKAVGWTYEGRSGSLLLAEVKSKGSTRCVVYLERENAPVALGGNDHCRWRDDPVLVWRANKAWLEFPQVIKQPVGLPSAINQFTAHFSKTARDICILGLPPTGYDAVRCPDDEPPDSR